MGATNQFIWEVGCQFGFVTETIKAQLIAITKNQWQSTIGAGGKAVASGSMAGESVAFAIPQGYNVSTLPNLCRDCYREITDFTDAEVEAYALRENISGIRGNFGTLET